MVRLTAQLSAEVGVRHCPPPFLVELLCCRHGFLPLIKSRRGSFPTVDGLRQLTQGLLELLEIPQVTLLHTALRLPQLG